MQIVKFYTYNPLNSIMLKLESIVLQILPAHELLLLKFFKLAIQFEQQFIHS
jgi:hypothetical protein